MNLGFKTIPFREVVTFSAEHPQNSVKNLLSPGSGKWSSPKGHDEIFIDVELSLPSCYIKSLDIGNYWSASIDIEVGRADEASSKREPLLKCPANFMSRSNCQNGENKEVMRFFNVGDFNPFSVGRWVDRIRIVCRQPFRRDVAFGLSTFVVRGNNLDDDSDDDVVPPTMKGYNVDMSSVDGVKILKSKLSKHLSASTPKSKYSNVLSLLSSGKNSRKKDHLTKHGSSADEFREVVLEFINDVDPDGTLEYKELLRRWVHIKGRPKTELEKSILKEVTKSHAYGISSKKTDLSNDVAKKTFVFKRQLDGEVNDSSFKRQKVQTGNYSDGTEDYSSQDSVSTPTQKPKGKRGRPPKNKTLLATTTSSTKLESASINYNLMEDPQRYVEYDDSDLRSAGILVHQKIYKKDKKLPLENGDDIMVERGVLVTFYKNAMHIHMKIREKVYKPEVDPEYVPGIFKDYTEQEIEMSDRLVIKTPYLPDSQPEPIANSPPSAKSAGSRKRKSNSPTKRVTSTASSPSGSSSPAPNIDTPKPSGSKGKRNLKRDTNPGPEGFPSRRNKKHSIGGECPLCQKSFSKIKELIAHCAVCNGTDDKKSSPVKAKGTSGRKKKTPAALSTSLSPVPVSECPICSKKVAKHELERHARLCAEKAFG